MSDNNTPPNTIRKGLVHLTHKDVYNDDNDHFYYPENVYLEDFEIEKNAALKLLEDYKPIDKNI